MLEKNKKNKTRAGEMAHQLRVCVGLVEDTSLDLSTHIGP